MVEVPVLKRSRYSIEYTWWLDGISFTDTKFLSRVLKSSYSKVSSSWLLDSERNSSCFDQRRWWYSYEQRYNWTRGYKCCNGVEQMLSWSRWCRLLHLQKVSEERIQSIDLIVQSVFFIWSLAKTIQIHSLIRSSQVDSWRVSPNNFEQCSAEDLWKIDLQTNQPLIWRSSSVMAVRLSF